MFCLKVSIALLILVQFSCGQSNQQCKSLGQYVSILVARTKSFLFYCVVFQRFDLFTNSMKEKEDESSNKLKNQKKKKNNQ